MSSVLYSTQLRRSLGISSAIGLLISQAALAATPAATPLTIEIDLGSHTRVVSVPIKSGDVQFRLKNLIPHVTYEVTIGTLVVDALPAPFAPLGGNAAPAGAETVVQPPPPSPCDVQRRVIEGTIAEAQDEFAVAAAEAQVLALTAAPGNCSDAEAKTAQDAFYKATTQTIATPLTVTDGEEITVTVHRVAGKNTSGANVADAQMKPFTFFTPGVSSQWLVLYGFNFIDSKDQTYYSKQNTGTPTTYTITPQANRSPHQFAPSVNFMWLPASNYTHGVPRAFAWRGEDMFGGVTAGLGFDTANPVVLLGYGVGWGYNVLLNVGVAMHKEKRLLGRYNPNDPISDNLTPDQLSQDSYRSTFYVGVAFRFGSNPFGSKGSTPNTPSAK